MTSNAQRRTTVLELIYGGPARGARQERPYLLLEDLVDEPIELRLDDTADDDAPTSPTRQGPLH